MNETKFSPEERRRNEEFAGRVAKYFTNPLSRRLLDVEVTGKVPSGSFIGACHHQLGMDSWVLGNTLYSKYGIKTHFWVQVENVYASGWNGLLERLEQIPLKVTKASKQSLLETCAESIWWLNNTSDGVMVFTDGPSVGGVERDSSGRVTRIKPLEERPNYAPAQLSIESGKPIVPIAEWCKSEDAERLWCWGVGEARYFLSRKFGGIFKMLGNFAYLYKNKPLKYKIALGEPLYASGKTIAARRILREKVREEQIKLYESLRS